MKGTSGGLISEGGGGVGARRRCSRQKAYHVQRHGGVGEPRVYH